MSRESLTLSQNPASAPVSLKLGAARLSKVLAQTAGQKNAKSKSGLVWMADIDTGMLNSCALW